MTTPAWQSSIPNPAYDGSFGGDHSLATLSPGEPIGRPSPRAASGSALRGVLFLIVVLGGGWALIGDRAALRDWVRMVSASISSGPSAPQIRSSESLASPLSASSASGVAEPVPKLVAVEIPPAPPIASIPALASTGPDKAAASLDADAAVTPLPPPVANPADPYETRALAAGLHPGLSQVLLTRLSDADYRNARVAIQKAIAETPDSGVFIWPRQRKPELALFRVGFVPGAAAHCRRYVVIVTKDGWSTTALPMERCGPPADAKGR